MANNWAIVVGIDEYDFLPEAPLKFAGNDALAMKAWLCDEGGFPENQVFLCTDGTAGTRKATCPVLRDILLNQLEGAQEADNLWFFFSGYGTFDYLLTIDGNPRDWLNTAVSLFLITHRLRAYRAKNIVLILNICRDESWVSSQEREETSLRPLVIGHDESWVSSQEREETSLRLLVKEHMGDRGITTLLSCRPGQRSYELSTLKQGTFTHTLLEGLQQTGILKDLETYLVRRVPELHREAGQPAKEQVPVIIPEPGWKYEEPLLNDYATSTNASQPTELPIDAELGKKIGDVIRRSELQPEMTAPFRLQRDINHIPLSSEKGVDYGHLRDLLKSRKWEEADKETSRIISQACNSFDWRLDGDPLKSLEALPNEDWKTIDQLWVASSNGHFGFSVQKEIWEKCGRPMSYDSNYYDFHRRVGWLNKSSVVRYSILEKNLLHSPAGELPFFTSATWCGLEGQPLWVGFVLFSRIDL